MINSPRQLLCLASSVLAPDVAGIIAPYCCNTASQDGHNRADQVNTEVPNIKGQTTSNGTDGIGNLHNRQNPNSLCPQICVWQVGRMATHGIKQETATMNRSIPSATVCPSSWIPHTAQQSAHPAGAPHSSPDDIWVAPSRTQLWTTCNNQQW